VRKAPGLALQCAQPLQQPDHGSYGVGTGADTDSSGVGADSSGAGTDSSVVRLLIVMRRSLRA
jgi:hypothetical protein